MRTDRDSHSGQTNSESQNYLSQTILVTSPDYQSLFVTKDKCVERGEVGTGLQRDKSVYAVMALWRNSMR